MRASVWRAHICAPRGINQAKSTSYVALHFLRGRPPTLGNLRLSGPLAGSNCRRWVMVRLLREATALPGGAGLSWRDHRRAAKKRARAIQFTRGRPRRVQRYRELIKTTRATLAYLHHAAAQLATAVDPAIMLWQAQVRHHQPLIARIIAQTERRVLAGEPVAASEKLVSLFEPHADIIVKGSREVAY